MRYTFKNAISHITHAGTSNAMSLLGIAFITTLLAALLLNHSLISQHAEFESHAPTLVAYLKDTVSESKGRTLGNQIEKNTRILAVNYISKAENRARGETEFRDLGSLIKEAFAETRGVNPFPASLNITVDEELITRKTLEKMTLDNKAYEDIEDVSLTGQGQLNDRLRQHLRTVFAGIAFAMAVVWFIIRTTLKKTAITRSEEIALMKLLGALRHTLRLPFIIHGLFLGALGTLCGVACFYGMFHLFKLQLGPVDFLNIHQQAAVVAGGMGIGFIASLTTQRAFVRR